MWGVPIHKRSPIPLKNKLGIQPRQTILRLLQSEFQEAFSFFSQQGKSQEQGKGKGPEHGHGKVQEQGKGKGQEPVKGKGQEQGKGQDQGKGKAAPHK